MFKFFLGVICGMGMGVVPHCITLLELRDLRESLKFKERERHEAIEEPYYG